MNKSRILSAGLFVMGTAMLAGQTGQECEKVDVCTENPAPVHS